MTFLMPFSLDLLEILLSSQNLIQSQREETSSLIVFSLVVLSSMIDLH